MDVDAPALVNDMSDRIINSGCSCAFIHTVRDSCCTPLTRPSSVSLPFCFYGFLGSAQFDNRMVQKNERFR